MNNINDLNYSFCVGCGGCAITCPKNAIEMIEDDFGFYKPLVNEKKCVECGLCLKTCCVLKQNKCFFPHKAYAVSLKSQDVLRKSSSGGAFWAIASNFLKKGGVVVGAKLFYENGSFDCRHVICSCIDDLVTVQGSKYFQSKSWLVFPDIKKLLKKNIKVLYSGTACQIAALKNYIGYDEQNLYTVEIICHGTPNRRLFNDFVKCKNEKWNCQIINYLFRAKEKNCGYDAKVFYEKNGVIRYKIVPATLNSFTYFFLKGVIMRASCYTCFFAKKDRIGDVTIGDFWGFDENCKMPKNKTPFLSRKGISFELINTTRGEDLHKISIDSINFFDVDYSIVIKGNEQFNKPCHPMFDSNKILSLYKEGGWNAVENLFLKKMGKKIYWYRLMNNIPLTIRTRIKKILKWATGFVCKKSD